MSAGSGDPSLNTGCSFHYSCGADGGCGRSLVTYPGIYPGLMSVGQTEVFTISAAIPEPETGALMIGGLALLGLAVRWRGWPRVSRSLPTPPAMPPPGGIGVRS